MIEVVLNEIDATNLHRLFQAHNQDFFKAWRLARATSMCLGQSC